MPLFSRKRKAGTGSPEPEERAAAGDGAAPEAAPRKARRARRRSSPTTRRIILAVIGALVLAASVAGFYLTSEAFDERTPVLVAARDIEAGETVAASDFTSALMVVDPVVPFTRWTPGAPFEFSGKVAAQAILMGELVRGSMLIEENTVPRGVELEVVVPLDTSLATQGVFDGDLVLLIDPGVEPTESGPGRPRRVVRQFELRNFDGSRMRLILEPEEWAEWERLLAEVGATLMVQKVGLAGNPAETADEMAARLDAVWQEQWSAAVEEVAGAVAVQTGPEAGPGELEVIVSLDTSLVPSEVSEGDLVLLVDPGEPPTGNNRGRSRSVLGVPRSGEGLEAVELEKRAIELEHYADGQMRRFEPPGEWLWWHSLQSELGAAPLVLPVPDGSDVGAMIGRLDAEWRAAWERAVQEALASAGASQ